MEISDALRNFFIGAGLFTVGGLLSLTAISDDGSGVVFTGLLGMGAIFMVVSVLHGFIILFRDLGWKGRSILIIGVIAISGSSWIAGASYFNPDATLARANAKSGIVWEVNLENELEGKIRSTALTSKGMILFGGSYKPNQTGSDIYFGMLDQDGVLLWDRRIAGEGTDEITSISLLDDGGAILTGFSSSNSLGKHDGILIKINSSGEILWQNRYGGKNDDWLDKTVILPNGDILAAGYTASRGDKNGDGFLIRTNRDGELIWEKAVGGKGRTSLYSVSLVDTNAVMIAGESSQHNGKDSVAYYSKLNLDGEAIWEYSVGNKGVGVALTMMPYAGDSTLIAGSLSSENSKKASMFFAKIDIDGEILSEGTYDVSESKNEKIYSIALTSENEILLGGFAYYDNSRASNLALIQVDQEGNVISDHRFRLNQKGRIYSLAVLPNDEVIVSGYSRNNNGIAHMYIMKTNLFQ